MPAPTMVRAQAARNGRVGLNLAVVGPRSDSVRRMDEQVVGDKVARPVSLPTSQLDENGRVTLTCERIKEKRGKRAI